MESPLSKEKLTETFKKADVNGSGKLTVSQMKDLMKDLVEDNQKIDFKEEEFVFICEMADLNGDKMINYDELYNLFHGDTIDEADSMMIA